MSMQLEECIAVLDAAAKAWSRETASGINQPNWAEWEEDARQALAAAVLGICVALGCPSDRAEAIGFLSSQPR